MNLYNDSGIISSLGYNLREQLLSISGHCSACVNVGVPSGSRFLYDYQSYSSLWKFV